MGQALLGYCPPKDSEDLGTNENVSGGSSVCIYWDWDFFFFFWPYHMAFGILTPQPGIEPVPLAMKVWSPNHSIHQGIPKQNNLK